VVFPGVGLIQRSPIATYQGQGVAKSGVIKSQHAIAFIGKTEPNAKSNEAPKNTDSGPMLPGIRIIPNRKVDKVDPMARIDFARTYTVEHNVKVYDFGVVADDYLDRLASQWVKVMLQGENLTAHLGALNSNVATGSDSDESEEEDDRPRRRRKKRETDSEEEESGEEHKVRGKSSREGKGRRK
jgi:hypothetical protein